MGASFFDAVGGFPFDGGQCTPKNLDGTGNVDETVG